MQEFLQPKGSIEIIVQHKDGTTTMYVNNTVLQAGREALAASLSHAFGSNYEFYIDTMVFGTGGVDGNNIKKSIDASRNSLWNEAKEKPVSAIVDTVRPHEAIFTSVLPFDDGGDLEISEMGLRMANGDLYSMATFPNITKTDSIQITWNWRVSFV